MRIKWSKTAVKGLLEALDYLEERGFNKYAAQLESDLIHAIENLPSTYLHYEKDRFKRNNDSTYSALVIDNYRVSFRVMASEIHILRIRHTSRKPL